MRLCQNRGRGRDNLDGQGLRLLQWCKSISFVVLPAANLHHKYERRGHLLPHGRFWKPRWMESQMDGGDTRSGYSSHNCIIMISNITMIHRTYKTNSRRKIYDFVLRFRGSSAKAEKNCFWYHSQMALKEIEQYRLTRRYIKQWENLCSAKSCLSQNNQQKAK